MKILDLRRSMHMTANGENPWPMYKIAEIGGAGGTMCVDPTRKQLLLDNIFPLFEVITGNLAASAQVGSGSWGIVSTLTIAETKLACKRSRNPGEVDRHIGFAATKALVSLSQGIEALRKGGANTIQHEDQSFEFNPATPLLIFKPNKSSSQGDRIRTVMISEFIEGSGATELEAPPLRQPRLWSERLFVKAE
ncbi:hypothetical protein IPL85_05715 [Candidatus Saccharibacteria bacterium]|nr:MAG: hypothetical protein IPL85_05715 [Candidatus Saccharibacteria bacterium]